MKKFNDDYSILSGFFAIIETLFIIGIIATTAYYIVDTHKKVNEVYNYVIEAKK